MSFNEYFEAIKDMAVEGAQTAVKKTKQIASIAKANLAIHTEEEKIRKAQIELGKLYYKDYIVGEEPDAAEYNPWCEKISESKIVIEDLKISMEDMRSDGADEKEDEDFTVEFTVEDAPDAPGAPASDAETSCYEKTAVCEDDEAPAVDHSDNIIIHEFAEPEEE